MRLSSLRARVGLNSPFKLLHIFCKPLTSILTEINHPYCRLRHRRLRRLLFSVLLQPRIVRVVLSSAG